MVTPRAGLMQLGKLVAADMAQGGRSGNTRAAGEAVASRPTFNGL
jgi:hypothetical protein